MIVELASPAEARAWCLGARAAGRTLGFVPTMGALHEGHLELVARALRENDVTCASVYVNPLQFNDRADFERYPRDFAADARRLEALGVAMVFTGTLAGFFPGDLRADGTLKPARLLAPGPSAEGLEGAHRPGHFAGMITIVERLFDCVQPTRAYFGQKDYQQTLVVRDLARRQKRPEIVVCPTSRERSGLARSSRNMLLSKSELDRAVCLSRGLKAAEKAWKKGLRDAQALRAILQAEIARPGVEIEYAELRDPERWTASAPQGNMKRAIALVAARVGGVRLIDNMYLSAPPRGS
ncbi:MAG: pantoate--beta-alanine ligase [Planctomycetes bacterium]|nr:pantoate--beta-alanine ligase [Planctomycetota bacterium]